MKFSSCSKKQMFNLMLFLLQKYIAEEVGSDEKLSWVKHHMEKGFAGINAVLFGRELPKMTVSAALRIHRIWALA